MNTTELAERLHLEVLALPEPSREVTGAYAGDLLSWVMSRAAEGCIWATIMTNDNVIAVATLVECAAVVICEGSEVPQDMASLAASKSVNLLRTALPVYEFCAALSGILA